MPSSTPSQRPIPDKESGAVATPPQIAAQLTEWAIRSPSDRILDAGAGDGVFALAAVQRLRQLGAAADAAAAQVIAVEDNPEAFEQMKARFAEQGIDTGNLRQTDLFNETLPSVNAVIGNPPYVRRWWLSEELLERFERTESSRLTDLACHFTVKASSFLEPDGRLAVIITDSWLDTRYGTQFKDFLKKRFARISIVGFKEKVFSDAMVRPVLLMADNADEEQGPTVSFSHGSVLDGNTPRHCDRATTTTSGTVQVDASVLSPNRAWSRFLYAPDAYFEVSSSQRVVPLEFLMRSRIGIQTFARDFFILTRTEAEEADLEEEFLVPLLFSPKDCPADKLQLGASDTQYLLFVCDLPIGELHGTAASRYIRDAEQLRSKPRGRAGEVVGVQNRPRIARARRDPWYNLKDLVQRRGGWPIAIPRRFYVSYSGWLNPDALPVNENFIELSPRVGLDPELCGAALLSSFGELGMRVHAHQYGGGVYDLSPGRMGSVPVLDVRALSDARRQRVLEALANIGEQGWRDQLDRALAEGLGIGAQLVEDAQQSCKELRRGAKQVAGRGG